MILMDLSLPYLAQLTVILASFAFVFLLKRLISSTYFDSVTLPPGKKGWLGGIIESWQFYAHCKHGSPAKFVLERMTEHSRDVFTMSILGTNVAVLCGASGNKYLCSTTGKNIFKPCFPSSVTKIIPEVAHDSISDSHLPTTVKSLIYDFLKPEYLQQYIPVMDSMAKEHLNLDWLPNKVVKVVPLLDKLVFAIALRLFISVEDPEVVETFKYSFDLLNAGLISVPINLPGTPFNRALKGEKFIRKQLISIIKERNKKSTPARVDALDRMLVTTDENGRNMSETEIAGKIKTMLVASHSSIITIITSVVKCLAENPHICEKVFEEQIGIANSKVKGELLSWHDVNKMKYSWCVACEAMRIVPNSSFVLSEAKMNITYAGFTIPKGMKTAYAPSSTHMNPEYYSNPERFDPSRFEGQSPAPFTFTPFGGGLRICPGREYARVLILVFMHNLVTKFKFEKMNPHKKIQYHLIPLAVPKDGLPIHLYPTRAEI